MLLMLKPILAFMVMILLAWGEKVERLLELKVLHLEIIQRHLVVILKHLDIIQQHPVIILMQKVTVH